MYHWFYGLVLHFHISGDALKLVVKHPQHAVNTIEFDTNEQEAGSGDSESVIDEMLCTDGQLQLSRASTRIFAQLLFDMIICTHFVITSLDYRWYLIVLLLIHIHQVYSLQITLWTVCTRWLLLTNGLISIHVQYLFCIEQQNKNNLI